MEETVDDSVASVDRELAECLNDNVPDSFSTEPNVDGAAPSQTILLQHAEHGMNSLVECVQVVDESGQIHLIPLSTENQIDPDTQLFQSHNDCYSQSFVAVLDNDQSEVCYQDVATIDTNNEMHLIADGKINGFQQLMTEETHELSSTNEDNSKLIQSSECTDDMSVNVGGTTELDINCPISLTSDMVVVVDGKQCVLRFGPDANTLVAYPLRANSVTDGVTKRQRGRPRKNPVVMECNYVLTNDANTNASQHLQNNEANGNPGVILSEKENSAAECLLGLKDGSQITPKKERTDRNSSGNGEIISHFNKSDKQLAAALPASENQVKNILANMGLPVKRGRGRPRRSPLPSTTTVPPFLIPSSDGQSVIMACIQEESASPEMSASNHETTENSSSQVKETSIIIEQEDGTERHIILSTGADLKTGLDGCDSTVIKNDRGGDGEMNDESSLFIPSSVLDVPQNYLVKFSSKEPVKIGLKAKERELQNLKCCKCNFQAYYSQQLQLHISEQHYCDEILKCKCCSYLSLQQNDLNSHFKESHPKCICEICGFTAEHSYIIRRHMQRHEENGAECKECGKKYKDQYILKNHIRMVHCPTDVLFQCTICSKEFNRKAHLKRHLRTHNPDKPFKCPDPNCSYRGCERSDINKHILIHNEPQFSCNICGKLFRHIKNRDLHAKRHRGQRDYKCGVCNFFGYTFTDIRKHIERKHSDLRHTSCDKCASIFKTEAQLRDHECKHCDVMMLDESICVGDETSVGNCYIDDSVQLQLMSDGHQLLSGSKPIILRGSLSNIAIDGITFTDENTNVQLMGVHLVSDENSQEMQNDDDLIQR